jgi:hypothetical protein
VKKREPVGDGDARGAWMNGRVDWKDWFETIRRVVLFFLVLVASRSDRFMGSFAEGDL